MAVTVPAVTVKLALEAPAATVTDAGVVRDELLSDSVTLAPPVGAAPDSVTVHVDVPPDVTLVGEHARLDSPEVKAWAEIVPPVLETATEEPSGEDPIPLLIDTGTVVPLVAESWTPTTATTPLLNWLAFIPLARQVMDPVPALQFTVLAAAVDAAPAVTVTELISVGE